MLLFAVRKHGGSVLKHMVVQQRNNHLRLFVIARVRVEPALFVRRLRAALGSVVRHRCAERELRQIQWCFARLVLFVGGRQKKVRQLSIFFF